MSMVVGIRLMIRGFEMGFDTSTSKPGRHAQPETVARDGAQEKWTPRPWSWEQFANGGGDAIPGRYEIVSNNDDDCFVAETITKYNAALIAAAPELYEALTKLMRAVNQRDAACVAGTPHQMQSAAERVQSAIDKASAALAKARGEQS